MNNRFAQEFNFCQPIFPQPVNYAPYPLMGIPILMFVPISYNIQPILIPQDAGVPTNVEIGNPIIEEPWFFKSSPIIEGPKQPDNIFNEPSSLQIADDNDNSASKEDQTHAEHR